MNKLVKTGLEALLAGTLIFAGCEEPQESIDAKAIEQENAELKALNNDLNYKLNQLRSGININLPLQESPFESSIYYAENHNKDKLAYTGVCFILSKYYVNSLSKNFCRIRLTFTEDPTKEPIIIDLEHADKNKGFAAATNLLSPLNHPLLNPKIKIEGLEYTTLSTKLVYEGPLNPQSVAHPRQTEPEGFSY